MFLHRITYLLMVLIGWSASATSVEVPIQGAIDRAYEVILQTDLGRAVCRDILGADPEALEFHLGVSMEAAEKIAPNCRNSTPTTWIYQTSPADIRKLTLKNKQHRRYKLVKTDQTFPIESWTDSFTNSTAILTTTQQIPFTRLVQLLAHEMAVYFDSKTHPAHPGALSIPELAGLKVSNTTQMNALIAVSDPLTAHTLTYLRALQVEFNIVDELVTKNIIVAPSDFKDSYLRYLISDRCTHSCVESLILRLRSNYLPISLPMLAFAPYYRAVINAELPLLQPLWTNQQWMSAQMALNQYPEDFLKTKFTGDVIADLSRVFYAGESNRASFQTVTNFLNQDLWPLEWPAISSSRLIDRNMSLLEYLKLPLMSGYNVLLSSGPRVRIRGGNTE